MITTITLEVRCDRGTRCVAYTTQMDGEEIDHDILDERLHDEGWTVTENGEHICPGCAYAYHAECKAEMEEAERDAALDDPRRGQAAPIMRTGSY